MERLADVFQSIPVYRNLAEKIFPNGSEIQCRTCGIARHCTVGEIAEWAHYGFPRCKKCGERTDLVNPYVRKDLQEPLLQSVEPTTLGSVSSESETG